MLSNPERGLLYTSTLIHIARVANPGDPLPAQVCLSAIALAELSVGPLRVEDPTEPARRQQHVQLAAEVELLPFDALSAATAIANGLPLYTGDARDFKGTLGLDLRPVPMPNA